VKKSREILKQFWGFDSFRPLQEDIVDSAVYGHDTLAILPTGGGKSICFQVPGIALEGITIIVSPLIALMEDQVNNLQSRGINAGLIVSSMSYREIDITLDNARFGGMKFLYTSPERIKSELFRERFKLMKVGLIVVDEAHCISEWGHDFRPAYREIAQLRELHPHTPMIAVTASATKRVQEDIVLQLKLQKPNVFLASLERKNIHYQVHESVNKLQDVIKFCQNNSSDTGIIYCQTRRSVKFVVTQLRALKINAGFYHGGLKPEDRKYMLEHWMQGKLKVMVATNAFGMGIDKSDVRYVLHYEVPNNLESYYQEAGRAGRDEKDAQAIAFWEEKDLETMREQLLMKYPSIDRVKLIYNSVCNFLQIAIGSGEQESYDFDIQQFHKAFSIPISETYYALKILQLNETLSFSENSFHATRLKFAIGNSALYKFQVTHASINDLVLSLTRSYPGIFDRFISIDEVQIAKRLKLNKSELTKQLKFLEQYGVIDINFQTNLPKITLLTERMPDGYLNLSNDIYLKRKEIEEGKLTAILNYIQSSDCRSQLINAYFDTEVEECGVCDSCLKRSLSNDTDKILQEQLLKILPSDKERITNELNTNIERTERLLRTLQLQELIVFDNGVFLLKK